jgi:hypothetical protein
LDARRSIGVREAPLGLDGNPIRSPVASPT